MSIQFPKIDTQEKKKIQSKGWYIFGVVFLCFIASLIVRGVVSDRIDNISQADNSLEASLPRIGFGAPQLFNKEEIEKEKDTDPVKYKYTAGSAQPFNVLLNVSLNPEAKKIGKREVIAFNTNSVMAGVIDVSKIDVDSYLFVPIKAKINTKDVVVNIGGKSFSGAIMNDSECCDFPEKYNLLTIKGSDILKLFPNSGSEEFKIEFTTKGSSSLEFLPSGAYTVSVITHHKNIKITRSDIGAVNDEKIVTFKINEEEYSYRDYGFLGEESGVSTQIPRVELLSGVDDIRMVDRSTKYALLIIILTFACLFFFDLKQKSTANILQYLLVGVSLAMFYLLTLSVGEYIGFTNSYILATITTSLLNGWYTANVFKSNKYGGMISLSILSLYTILYFLLKLESFSLLAGTILLYTVLVVFMYASRKMNRV